MWIFQDDFIPRGKLTKDGNYNIISDYLGTPVEAYDNARFQPKHRFELEDALQEILQKEHMGEVTGGGTAQNPDGEIAYCEIEIHLANDEMTSVKWLTELFNRISIPKGLINKC